MSSAAHRRGLLRLLLGVTFVLLGWLFLSATPAAADDTAAPVVVAVTAAVEEVVVSPVVESESLPVAETVTEPIAAVVEPATQVVEDSVATTVPKAVATTTEVIEAAVEATPVAPVVSGPVAAVTEIVRDTTSTLAVDVVEPVVSGAGTVLGTASELPVPGALPAPQVAVPSVSSTPGSPATFPAASQARPERLAADGVRVVSDPGSLASTTPSVGRTTALGATEPHADPPRLPVRGPVPTGPEAGLLPAPSNASSGGSAGHDAASTPLVFTLPMAASVNSLPAVQRPAAGPVPDPGSRPD